MTARIDRYVRETVLLLPKKQRPEVAAELQATIADTVDARVQEGQSADSAEYAVLTELGDPARLAARYTSSATSLISPRTYPFYVRTLRWSCLILLPIIYIANDIGYWVRGDGIAAGIFGPIGITLTVAMYLLVVTAFFVVLDRHSRRDAWTPDHLPHL